jgi:molybdopterin-guanine dinucleotide biosynthesis protein
MAMVVVGGSARGVGKTSLVCGVIATTPERKWIAVKVTNHAYGADELLREETERGEGSDTARFLEAGARRAFLLTAQDSAEMQSAVEALGRILEPGANLIVESNRILDSVNADLCIIVAGDTAPKASFAAAIARADAIVASETSDVQVEPGERPVFRLREHEQLSPELADWIQSRLIYC